MFKARHQQSTKNAACIVGGKLVVGMVLCAASLVAFVPQAQAQLDPSLSDPSMMGSIDPSMTGGLITQSALTDPSMTAVTGATNMTGATGLTGGTDPFGGTGMLVDVTDPNVFFFNGFDTPGLLPQAPDGGASQGNNGYDGLNSAYQPQGSMPVQGGGGIYNGQVSKGTDSGGILTANGQSIGGAGNSQGGASGNPLTKEQYNLSGPPTRPSGTLVEAGSISSQQTDSGGPGTVPIQTIAPY